METKVTHSWRLYNTKPVAFYVTLEGKIPRTPTWESLPADLQAILTVAMKTAAYDMYTQSKHESGKNWASIQSEYPNVEVKDFPAEVISALEEANERLLAEHAAKDELAKKIQESQAAYIEQVRPWSNISHRAYLNSQAE